MGEEEPVSVFSATSMNSRQDAHRALGWRSLAPSTQYHSSLTILRFLDSDLPGTPFYLPPLTPMIPTPYDAKSWAGTRFPFKQPKLFRLSVSSGTLSTSFTNDVGIRPCRAREVSEDNPIRANLRCSVLRYFNGRCKRRTHRNVQGASRYRSGPQRPSCRLYHQGWLVSRALHASLTPSQGRHDPCKYLGRNYQASDEDSQEPWMQVYLV